jgi:hypothetical protein
MKNSLSEIIPIIAFHAVIVAVLLGLAVIPNHPTKHGEGVATCTLDGRYGFAGQESHAIVRCPRDWDAEDRFAVSAGAKEDYQALLRMKKITCTYEKVRARPLFGVRIINASKPRWPCMSISPSMALDYYYKIS